MMKSKSCGGCGEVNISICKPQDHGLGGIFMLRMKNGEGESLINPLVNVGLLLLATRGVLTYHYLSFTLIMVKVGVSPNNLKCKYSLSPIYFLYQFNLNSDVSM